MSILTKILLDGLGGLASAATLYETGKGVCADIKKHQKTSENIRRQPSESDDGKADCRTGHR